MKVFLTGGTGHIGSAIIPALLDAGHEVSALARSAESAQAVSSAGAKPVHGDLTDTDVPRDAAVAADAAIHAGSPGDASSADVDRAAAAALQEGLGDDGVYVHTGGIWVFGSTDGEVNEDAPQSPPALTAWRGEVEEEVLGRGNARLVMPAVVYGNDRAGLIELAYGPEAEDGAGRFPGDGTAHCTTVHAADVGALYALVLQAPAGTVVAGVTECVPVRALAEALGGGAAETDAGFEDRLGMLAEPMALDQQVSNERARGLGWEPAHVNVLGELRGEG